MPALLIVLSILLLIVIALYIGAPHPSATPLSVEKLSDLEAYFERLVASGSPPRLSVAVVKDGKQIIDRPSFHCHPERNPAYRRLRTGLVDQGSSRRACP